MEDDNNLVELIEAKQKLERLQNIDEYYILTQNEDGSWRRGEK